MTSSQTRSLATLLVVLAACEASESESVAQRGSGGAGGTGGSGGENSACTLAPSCESSAPGAAPLRIERVTCGWSLDFEDDARLESCWPRLDSCGRVFVDIATGAEAQRLLFVEGPLRWPFVLEPSHAERTLVGVYVAKCPEQGYEVRVTGARRNDDGLLELDVERFGCGSRGDAPSQPYEVIVLDAGGPVELGCVRVTERICVPGEPGECHR